VVDADTPPARHSWPISTSISGTQKNRTHALYYHPFSSNSPITQTSPSTLFSLCTLHISYPYLAMVVQTSGSGFRCFVLSASAYYCTRCTRFSQKRELHQMESAQTLRTVPDQRSHDSRSEVACWVNCIACGKLHQPRVITMNLEDSLSWLRLYVPVCVPKAAPMPSMSIVKITRGIRLG
jgi:hypothetical protein